MAVFSTERAGRSFAGSVMPGSFVSGVDAVKIIRELDEALRAA
ncbi:hypothetical protein [Mesorhizobium montanum]|nr:hypothetical protein [Mesorhizobium sp. MSK_1335]